MLAMRGVEQLCGGWGGAGSNQLDDFLRTGQTRQLLVTQTRVSGFVGSEALADRYERLRQTTTRFEGGALIALRRALDFLVLPELAEAQRKKRRQLIEARGFRGKLAARPPPALRPADSHERRDVDAVLTLVLLLEDQVLRAEAEAAARLTALRDTVLSLLPPERQSAACMSVRAWPPAWVESEGWHAKMRFEVRGPADGMHLQAAVTLCSILSRQSGEGCAAASRPTSEPCGCWARVGLSMPSHRREREQYRQAILALNLLPCR